MSDRPRVFVTRRIPEAGLNTILEQCDAEVWDGHLPPDRETLLQKIAGCDGVLSLLTERVDGEFMDAVGEQLKVISNFAVGFNNIDIPEATRRGIRVGNTPDVLTDATADMAFTLLISTFASGTLFSIIMSTMVVFIGHFIQMATSYWKKEAGMVADIFSTPFQIIFADLKMFDVVDEIITGAKFPFAQALELTGLGLFYVAIYTVIAQLVFVDKEF